MAKGRPPSGRPLSRERAERAKAATFTKVTAPTEPLGPELGEHPDWGTWHPLTLAWWEMWRTSPMAQIFTDVDWHFLIDTALIHAAYCHGNSNLAGELRLRTEKFGATARDRERMRLQIVEPTEVTQNPRGGLTGERRRRLELLTDKE